MLGTPDYIAPEQTLDAQKADIRADIYSLGCTLYCMLSGGPPFSGTSLYEILHAHHNVEARPLNLVRPEVPIELATVVSKMMAKDPAKRYQTPSEVAKALSPFFKGGAPKAAPGGERSLPPEVAPIPLPVTPIQIPQPFAVVTPAMPLAVVRPVSVPISTSTAFDDFSVATSSRPARSFGEAV
jgi:serine/threonine protein kinase